MSSIQAVGNQDYSNDDLQGPVCITRSFHGLRKIFPVLEKSRQRASRLTRTGLDVHELIDSLSWNPGYPYCNMQKVKIAELLGCSVRSIFYDINYGLAAGTLEQPEHEGDRECRKIRTTQYYRDQKAFELGKLDSKNHVKIARFPEEEQPPEKENRAKIADSEGQNRAKIALPYKDKLDKDKNPEFSSLTEKAEKLLLREFGYIPKYVNLKYPHKALKAIEQYKAAITDNFSGVHIFEKMYRSIPEDFTPSDRSPQERSRSPVEQIEMEIYEAITEMRKSKDFNIREMAVRIEMEMPGTDDTAVLQPILDKALKIIGAEKVQGQKGAFV